MVLIAVDPHKAQHVVAAVDEATGQVVAESKFGVDDAGMRSLVRWAAKLGDRDPLFAVEDVRNVTGRLERWLATEGCRVIRVAPYLTASARRRDRSPGKSDPIDARAVARAVLEHGVGAFPRAVTGDGAAEIRLRVEYRAGLVQERTRLISRLRWQLVLIAPELESDLERWQLTRSRPLQQVDESLARVPSSTRALIARSHALRIEQVTAAIDALQAELRILVADACPALLELPGCGVISAATLLGRVPDARQFPTAGHFARLAGVAPIPRSSGERTRMRAHPGGDRQLNAALHRIAITQAMTYPPARQYLQRKRSEGKTPGQAIAGLKRHLARRVWHLLKTAVPDQQRRLNQGESSIGQENRSRATPEDSSVLADVLALEAVIRDRIRTRLAELEPAVAEYEECREVRTDCDWTLRRRSAQRTNPIPRSPGNERAAFPQQMPCREQPCGYSLCLIGAPTALRRWVLSASLLNEKGPH